MSRRSLVMAAGVLMAMGALTVPAWAHVEVEAEPGVPAAADAVLKIMAEGESTAAGIRKLEVVADPAIPADQVTLVSGPVGWTMAAGTLGGFTVEGPALPPGRDAEVSVRVKQLPDAPQVVFKVVESHSDGTVARWIELPGPDGKEPEKPAAIVKLTPGAATVASPKPAGNDDDDEGGHGALARTGAADRALALAAGLLLAAGGAGLIAGARRPSHPPAG